MLLLHNTLSMETDLKRLPEKLVKDIEFELSELEQEINDMKPLCDLLINKEPDKVEIRAAAATLHSFYKGIEGIFILIAKHIDKTSFASEQWHISLLKSMREASTNRPVVNLLQLEYTVLMIIRDLKNCQYRL